MRIKRVFGRIKTFQILKGVIPISMSHLTDQIIYVYSFRTNFLPALVPLSQSSQEKNVEKYFEELRGTDNENGLDMDSDSSTID